MRLPTGEHNAVTDVPGVEVGQVTVWHGDPAVGDPVACTGVTAIVPGPLTDLFAAPDGGGHGRVERCG